MAELSLLQGGEVKLKITVRYSCHECGIKDAAVEVPARELEDVLVWMDATGRLLGADHARRSPRCRPDHLSDLKIPIEGADRVGGATVN